MGYRKVYGPEKKHQKRRKPRLLVLAVLLLCLHPGLREFNLELLIPGDRQTTGQALEVMAAELRAGGSLGEAVEAFCREVLSHDR